MIEYIEISEVTRGEIGEVKVYARGDEPSRARRRLRHGDTVLSTARPDRQAYFLCLNPSPNLIASTGFAVFTPSVAPWSYVYLSLVRADVFERLGLLADGAAYPAVAPEVIAEETAFLPSDDRLLEAFHTLCAPLLQQADENRMQSRSLGELRDALLPELIGGKIQVRSQLA